MSDFGRCVFWPTETINRELDGQLLALSSLLNPGDLGVIGKWDPVMRSAAKTPGSVVIGKAFHPAFPGSDLRLCRRVQAKSGRVLHLDEEGAVFMGDRFSDVLLRRLDPTVLASGDTIAVWGEEQGKVYARDQTRARVRVTGHPRFDLLRPDLRGYWQPEIRRLRDRFGEFVLFNSNFPRANHAAGPLSVLSPKPDVVLRGQALEAWTHAVRTALEALRVVDEVAAAVAPDYVIVRPHPSESPLFWERMTQHIPNVIVTRDGPVASWILASSAVLHCGCTTAIEAKLAEHPTVLFRPFPDERYEAALPIRVGRETRTSKEAVEAVQEVRKNPVAGLVDRVKRDDMQRFANLSGPTLDSFARAYRELVDSMDKTRVFRNTVLRTVKSHDLEDKLRKTASFVSGRHRKARRYVQGKFYGFRQAQIPEKLRRISEAASLPQEERLRADVISDHVAFVYKGDTPS